MPLLQMIQEVSFFRKQDQKSRKIINRIIMILQDMDQLVMGAESVLSIIQMKQKLKIQITDFCLEF